MKRLLPIPVVLAAASTFLASALPAFSADSGTVDARVTVQTACITLDQTSLDYGPQSFVQPGWIVNSNMQFDVTNCGSAAKLFGRGTDATNVSGSVTWTLDDSVEHQCTPGVNHYKFGLDGLQPVVWGVKVSKVDKQLLGNSLLAPGSAVDVSHRLFMPCTGSAGGGQTMSWQIVYTATL
jgi:hypothetical protein